MAAYTVYFNLHYTTCTVLNWHNSLNKSENINILLDVFSFLTNEKRMTIYAFVIMPNHFHIIYHTYEAYNNEQVKHSILSFTSKKILESMTAEEKEKFRVNKVDREFQFWKSKSLSVAIESPKFLQQKINYTHDNPRRAGLVKNNEDYYYCSYKSYLTGKSEFDFLSLW